MKKSMLLICKLSWLILISNSLFAQPAIIKNGMVVSEQIEASQVGLEILKAGGNAADAAVAMGYALAVVHPCCGNVGGGGFMTLHLANGKNIFINFRERAPLASTSTMFLDAKGNVIPNKTTYGYLAVATPGTVMGLETALEKYGTLSRQKIIAPAIKLAENGFALTAGDVKILKMGTDYFQKQPNVAAIFLKDNKPYKVGDILIQKDLAKTLKLISEKGSNVFYQGIIAEKIVHASQEQGGILTLEDFKKYNVTELTPIQCSYHGYTIISAPPPSSGGTTLCEILNIIEKYPVTNSIQRTHYLIEAMRFAYFDRNNQLGDPDFVSNPTDMLISKQHAQTIRKKISDFSPTKMMPKPVSSEGINTTHFSVLDRWGNAVSVTYTINNFFGARVIADDTGFFLNDEMDDFAIKPGEKNQFGLIQGSKNNIQPGKRPLSSMAPTIVLKNNKVVMILGSSGGPRIITATLLTMLNVLDYGMNIQEAVNMPRFHYQWLPDWIDMEPNAFSNNMIKALKMRGYHFKLHERWGAVEAIYIDPATSNISGANDERRPAGKALGY